MSLRAGGVRPWIVQRLSAVYMAAFVVVVLAMQWLAPVEDFVDWRERLSQPSLNVATLLFFAALFAHAWVGMRDVIMDYLHPVALRFVVLSAAAGYLLALSVWSARVLMGLW